MAALVERVLKRETYGEVQFFRLARTLAGQALYWGGAYWVDGLVIDCGPPATAREFTDALQGRAVDGLVITHHHEDHVGAAPFLAHERTARPRVHRRGIPLLRDGFPQEGYRKLTWGTAPRFTAEALGDMVETPHHHFQVVHTPGHAEDHVCLFEPERGWLFTGDLFLAERLRFLRADEDLARLVESLRAVGTLPAREIFCAHRGLVPDGPAALRRKADRLGLLHEEALVRLRRGDAVEEITRELVGPEGILTWASGGHFSARNFVLSAARGAGLLPGPRVPGGGERS